MTATRRYHFASFPGRAAVLAELKRTGSWSTRQLHAWARSNGGSEPTYAALAWYVRRGNVSYTPNRWTFVDRKRT